MTPVAFEIARIDHVQLAMPQGGEERPEAFYRIELVATPE